MGLGEGGAWHSFLQKFERYLLGAQECQERQGTPREVGEGTQGSSAKSARCVMGMILARAGLLPETWLWLASSHTTIKGSE